MKFYKYQGTGNDFVLIDNRALIFPKEQKIIAHLCDRRFGIGGDGVILLENDKDTPTDFKMVYYNADGRESTMCGNGGRCMVAFAHFLGIIKDECTFIAIDGIHQAKILGETVQLKMKEVTEIFSDQSDYVLNTGSPHYVKYVEDVKNYEVFQQGKQIRNSSKYQKEGINVNFVEKLSDDQIFVRTYERGVEEETYSCGTGVTAAALIFMKDNNISSVNIKTLGGNLKVYATQEDKAYKEIWLEGPAVQVFSGETSLEINN